MAAVLRGIHASMFGLCLVVVEFGYRLRSVQHMALRACVATCVRLEDFYS